VTIWLHRYVKLVVASTVLLIAAGGMVTSTRSGLAVPDWPNTYGQFMFSFPLEKMVGGIFYEHGHRMIASTVGFLTIILAVWTSKADPRRWVRWLGISALGAVILQGLLGGITVLFLLPAPVSIGHAGLAQLFFCLTISLALFTSPGWTTTQTAVDDPTLRRLAAATTVTVYCQIILGATMRHIEAGMAIPDFPFAFGHVLPPFWNAGIAVHFAHRLGAVLVTTAILATAGHVWFHHRTRRELVRPAMLLVLFVMTQVTLGAFVIWSGLQPIINTAHVVDGTLVLATSLVLTLRSFRCGFADVALAAGAVRNHDGQQSTMNGPTVESTQRV
jgi:cytochrome c oxidase assembly protein subunit 15